MRAWACVCVGVVGNKDAAAVDCKLLRRGVVKLAVEAVPRVLSVQVAAVAAAAIAKNSTVCSTRLHSAATAIADIQAVKLLAQKRRKAQQKCTKRARRKQSNTNYDRRNASHLVPIVYFHKLGAAA